MKGITFLFTGMILIGVGVLVALSSGGVRINGAHADAETAQIAKYAIGGGLGALGAILSLVGLISLARGSQQNTRNQQIMQTGVDAEGTVTFVDKNYSMRVNGVPIYSIVEYAYRDAAGNQHMRRISDLNSELVIRKGIQVGGRVAIKYSRQNPAESVIVFG